MDQLEQYRQQIVETALKHVPFDGWTDKVLTQSACENDIDPGYVEIIFPHGVIDAIAWHSQQADKAMAAHMESIETLANMPVPARVKEAVMWRLKYYAPQREAIRLALTLLSFPAYAPKATKLLYNTVDTVWFSIGDKSTDYNFYTKRMILAGIYSATLQIWLDDKSEDLAETAAFFDRRLKEVGTFGKCKKQLSSTLQALNPFTLFGKKQQTS